MKKEKKKIFRFFSSIPFPVLFHPFLRENYSKKKIFFLFFLVFCVSFAKGTQKAKFEAKFRVRERCELVPTGPIERFRVVVWAVEDRERLPPRKLRIARAHSENLNENLKFEEVRGLLGIAGPWPL